MPNHFPADRFDDVPDDLLRVGAHRAAPRKGRGWIAFAWAALATGTLVAAGVIGLALFTDAINIDLPFSAEESAAPEAVAPSPSAPSPSAQAPEPETVEPRLDPDVAITILNGTTTSGLANTVGESLLADGWAGVGTRANAATNDVAATTVFYADAADEAAARAVVESLGVGDVQLSSDYPQSPIVVLIGTDYPAAAG